jgi:uncharacterized protein with GYD domain
MSQQTTATRYVSLVDVSDPNVQNVQDLAATWGDVREELTEVGVEVENAHVILGEVDFVVVFAAESTEAAFRADVVLERHGLDVQTMEALPTEEFGALVEELH